MAAINTAAAIRFGTVPVQRVYAGAARVWPSTSTTTTDTPTTDTASS